MEADHADSDSSLCTSSVHQNTAGIGWMAHFHLPHRKDRPTIQKNLHGPLAATSPQETRLQRVSIDLEPDPVMEFKPHQDIENTDFI
jgi:hypothetical protein